MNARRITAAAVMNATTTPPPDATSRRIADATSAVVTPVPTAVPRVSAI
jgi:hypothetical protein